MKTTETPTPARRRSPIFWVPTAYFGMGLPFVVLNINPEKPDVPLNKNDAFQKVQKRRVQEKR